MERVKGIEPSFSAWEADVLPLNYTRIFAQYPGILQSPAVASTVPWSGNGANTNWQLSDLCFYWPLS